METARWRRIEQLYESARGREPGERAEFLTAACAGDAALRDEVESLLAADQHAGGFLTTPALGDDFVLSPPVANGNEQAAALVGRPIGPWRLTGLIASGGMGSVYRAERGDGQYEKQVAIKLIKPGMQTAALLSRFRKEWQALATLEHPNIARLIDGGTTEDGVPFLVMEYVEGEPIDTYCDHRKLPTRDRLELFRGVCLAVHYAHQKLLVHRDLKPGNILVTPDGTVKLLDFGIAQVLSPDQNAKAPVTTAASFLTPQFASPEQIRGEPVTTAGDVYSLGAVLYELLTGHRPYHFKTQRPQEIERIICEHEPTKPSAVIMRVEEPDADDGQLAAPLTPESVSRTRDGKPDKLRRRLAGDADNIVLMALRKEPERRYASAEQFAEDIRRHLVGLPVIAHKNTLRYRSAKFVKRHRGGVIAAGLLFVVLVGGIVGTTWQARRAAAAAKRAQTEARNVQQVLASMDVMFQTLGPRGDVTVKEVLSRGAERAVEVLAGQPRAQAALMETLAGRFESIGSWDDAVTWRQRALDLRREHTQNRERKRPASARDDDEWTIAKGAHHLALALYRAGRYEAAEPLFREALDLARGVGGDEHPTVTTFENDLALLLCDTGQYAAAERLFRRALAINRTRLGAAHPAVATSLNNLGWLHAEKGDYATAESLYREALALRRKLLGPDHLDLATSLQNLASVLRQQSKYPEAEPLQRAALAMRRKLLGAAHPSVAASLHSLGTLLKDMGHYGEAENLYREALSMRRDLLGETHPSTAVTLNNLAALLEGQGQYAVAEALHREALAIRRQVLGDEHRDVALSLHNLARLLKAQGNFQEAERIYREVLEMRRRLLGEHPDVALTSKEIASLLRRRGEYEAAEPLYRDALALQRKLLGNEHRDVAGTLNDLAILLARQRDYDGAGSCLRDALAIYRTLLGDEHLYVGVSLGNLANTLIDQNDPAAAEPLLREALAIHRASLPRAHLRTADVESSLGACLTRLGRYAEAEPLLLQSHARLQAARGEDDTRTHSALRRVVRLYDAWDKPDQAARFRAALQGNETPAEP